MKFMQLVVGFCVINNGIGNMTQKLFQNKPLGKDSYTVGDVFVYENTYYMLAVSSFDRGSVGGVSLINLHSGAIWDDSTAVNDIGNITVSELSDIIGAGVYRFRYVPKLIITEE
jgi:hypothetical protein